MVEGKCRLVAAVERRKVEQDDLRFCGLTFILALEAVAARSAIFACCETVAMKTFSVVARQYEHGREKTALSPLDRDIISDLKLDIEE